MKDSDTSKLYLTGDDEDWFACDELDCVALLFSNGCPLPTSVPAAPRSEELWSRLTNLPELCTADLDPLFQKEAARSRDWPAGPKYTFLSEILEDGRRGLYVYDFEPKQWQYKRLVIPQRPLLLSTLPRAIAHLLAQTRVTSSFASEQTFKLSITLHQGSRSTSNAKSGEAGPRDGFGA